jgi:uncharacterized protein YndB with AHSA1/START domain
VEFSDTYDLEVPPEVVFSTLTDPDHAQRWAPPGVRVGWLDRERVRVSVGKSGTAYEVKRDDDRLTLAWRRSARSDIHGKVAVLDGPAGGSRLRVDVSLPDTADADRVRDLIAAAVRELRRDVADNLSAG